MKRIDGLTLFLYGVLAVPVCALVVDRFDLFTPKHPDLFAGWTCRCTDGSLCVIERSDSRHMPAPFFGRSYAHGEDPSGGPDFRGSCKMPARVLVIDPAHHVDIGPKAPAPLPASNTGT